MWRRDRDLNPRYAINVCRFSRPVLSTTQPSLRFVGANNRIIGKGCKEENSLWSTDCVKCSQSDVDLLMMLVMCVIPRRLFY